MDAHLELPPTLISQTGPKTDQGPSLLGHDDVRDVLSHLSHELCRPLVSLRAGFDLLMGDAIQPISKEQRGHVQTMVGLCDDLLRLTRGYLDYACLIQGARPLRLGSYTLSALMVDLDRQFAPEAAARNLGWACQLIGDDAAVTTDASRLQQICGNLVANALKYTPPGGRVEVRADSQDASWSVDVSDSGPGIPTSDQGRVFEPFYRLSREERAGIEGNGLGLSICRELVGQMGGRIVLGSEPGKGTHVSIIFPRSGRSDD